MTDLTPTQRWYLTRMRRAALYAAGVTNERRSMLMEMVREGLIEWHGAGQHYEHHWRIADKGARLLDEQPKSGSFI